MIAKKWAEVIKYETKEVGTYKEAFDEVIAALAEILEQRDRALRQFRASGSRIIVTHVNKFGAENDCKNPVFVVWQDLSALALSYWRDLGLTPSGLKKIDEDAMKTKHVSTLGEILGDLEQSLMDGDGET